MSKDEAWKLRDVQACMLVGGVAAFCTAPTSVAGVVCVAVVAGLLCLSQLLFGR